LKRIKKAFFKFMKNKAEMTEDIKNEILEDKIQPEIIDEGGNSDTESQETEQEVVAPELTETEKLKNEVAELKDKYLRLYSEFDNFRKRTAKEKIDLIHTATEGLMVDMLGVVDDFDRAKTNAKEGEISDGIALIFNKLESTLQAKGLKEMVAKGEVFNADIHDCITQFPAPTPEEKGKVVDVIEKGYYLKDKVIRFAKVIVGN
jgi:molecular chaperone GrpE